LYYALLQGGASAIGLDNNELHLHKVNQFGDPIQIVVTVAKYNSSSSHSARILHLEGEEMFRSAKHKENLPPRSKINSHQCD
jgi:hypothetical protein